jgi:hypothetical protein
LEPAGVIGMLHRVVKLEALPDYRLRVAFADGTAGQVDLRSIIGRGIFGPLADPEYFARAIIDEFGAVTWPNGADLAPDAMYRELRDRGEWSLPPRRATPELMRR